MFWNLGANKSMDDEDIRYMNESQKNRRVGKFFGERLDVAEHSSLQGKTIDDKSIASLI